jgi:hypothetical protein
MHPEGKHRRVAASARKRSLPILIAVCIVPTTLSCAAGALAIGGVHALTFGLVFGVVLGVLAILFALFVGWLSHRI